MLDSGVLTYYRNVEDVGSGSKGSVRMGMCEVSGELSLSRLICRKQVKYNRGQKFGIAKILQNLRQLQCFNEKTWLKRYIIVHIESMTNYRAPKIISGKKF